MRLGIYVIFGYLCADYAIETVRNAYRTLVEDIEYLTHLLPTYAVLFPGIDDCLAQLLRICPLNCTVFTSCLGQDFPSFSPDSF